MHTYETLLKAYNTKRGEYKPMFRVCKMKMNGSGDLELYRQYWKYKVIKADGTPDYAQGGEWAQHLFVAVDKNSVMTVHRLDGNQDNQAKNLFDKLAGLNVWSNSSKYKMYEHQLRVSGRYSSREPDTTYPMSTGFKYNLKERVVVAHAPDVKKTTDKEATKPIIKYVQEVMKVMKVMMRLGTYDELAKSRWDAANKGLKVLPVFDMSEEAMALMAEHAYMTAYNITSVPPKYTRVPDMSKPEETTSYGYTYRPTMDVPIPEHEWKKAYHGRLVKNASVKLRELLKDKHGAYVKAEV